MNISQMMENKLKQSLALRRPGIIRTLLFSMKPLLARYGFSFEKRKSGATSIGLIRKVWRTPKKGVSSRRLVVIPGFGDGPLTWLPMFVSLSPTLSKKYDELVVLDFPGFHGYLSSERPIHSMEILRQSVFDILDSLRPTAIFGHSLGGWLATSYAQKCGFGERPLVHTAKYSGPDEVIVCSPSGILRTQEEYDNWGRTFDLAKDGHYGEFRKFIYEKEPLWFRWVADEYFSFLDKQESRDFIGSVQHENFILPDFGKVKTRFWILWGERDRLNPAHWMRDWLDYINGRCVGSPQREVQNAAEPLQAYGIIVQGSNHAPQAERPFVMRSVLKQIFSEGQSTGRWARWLIPFSRVVY